MLGVVRPVVVADAGMVAASDEEIAAADFILSILPPGDALALAQRFAPALAASNAKPASPSEATLDVTRMIREKLKTLRTI